MSAEGTVTTGRLERAVEAARDEAQVPTDESSRPAFGRVAARVSRKIRTIGRHVRMVRAYAPTGSYLVSDAVLARFLGQALARAGGCTVTAIDFHGRGEECTGVSLQIIAPYGSDIRVVAERMRVVSLEIVAAMLGSDHAGFGESGVDVAVIDVAEPA